MAYYANQKTKSPPESLKKKGSWWRVPGSGMTFGGVLGTSMISKVKGKTEISHNPRGVLRRLYLTHESFNRSNLFDLFLWSAGQATRHPFAVFGVIPITED
jgi:hypothetical protein